jgi:hypothetical protein
VKVDPEKARVHERGYILLALLLMVALISVGVMVTIQNTAFQIRRDREEELIHRGVQYARAVRLFVATFKRYPASIEELENTNNIRCLRKRYKDPITGKDFKLLYMTEVAAFERQAPKLLPAAQSEESPPKDAARDPNVDPAIFDTPPGENSDGKEPASPDAKGSDAPAATPEPDENAPEAKGAPPLQGVPIVGVVSLSKRESIREFAKKNHYDQWLFIFNPGSGKSGLINSPDQPNLLQHTADASSQSEEPHAAIATGPSQPNASGNASADQQ